MSKPKKHWCKHVVWKESALTGATWRIDGYYAVPRSWRCCPVCFALRPGVMTKQYDLILARSDR